MRLDSLSLHIYILHSKLEVCSHLGFLPCLLSKVTDMLNIIRQSLIVCFWSVLLSCAFSHKDKALTFHGCSKCHDIFSQKHINTTIIKLQKYLQFDMKAIYLHEYHVLHIDTRRWLYGTHELDKPCFPTTRLTHDDHRNVTSIMNNKVIWIHLKC